MRISCCLSTETEYQALAEIIHAGLSVSLAMVAELSVDEAASWVSYFMVEMAAAGDFRSFFGYSVVDIYEWLGLP